ncbi:type 1 glutamine amidotransferase [Companilactobacillus versmoldensis]|nr:type 1 glutamine amidotransferase [Companilactobacillus versmoldensis]
MRINVLQHTPNEGPGSIQDWSNKHGHQMYVYHPYQFGILPTAEETDMLVVLGGPMSPNDNLGWIKQERVLISQLLNYHKPIFGACFGAQQIAKTLGYSVKKAQAKEVGWAPVYLKSQQIPDLPPKMIALHWHEEMCEIPNQAELLFSSDLVRNQGFILGGNVLGLQFHFEPKADNVREMVVNDWKYALHQNDWKYALHQNDLKQTPTDILAQPVPAENKTVMYKLLDYIVEDK